MDAETFALQFREPELARLREVADVGDPVRVGELDGPLARRRLADADVLITSWGVPALTAERLLAAPRLRAVLHAAGSVRGFVGPEVWRRGIHVSAAADMNAVPVAEFTFAAIVMAGKKAPFLAARSRDEGRQPVWAQLRSREDLSNCDRTIGVVGFSRIGRRVVDLLRLLENREVLVADPYADPVQVAEAGARLVGLHELLRCSEALTLHAPALPSTCRLIGASELALLPDGATVINTARGAILDHDALVAECATGRLDAILDVTDPEPLPPGHPLLTLPNVMVTPHVAGSLGAEARRLTAHALGELERWVVGEPLVSPVNPEEVEVRA